MVVKMGAEAQPLALLARAFVGCPVPLQGHLDVRLLQGEPHVPAHGHIATKA